MIPDLLSISRIPLAFLLTSFPIPAIVLACLSDIFDGYLARKWRSTTPLGTFLDPLTDKFFALFALAVLFFNGQMSLFQIGLFLARELALLIFLFILLVQGKWPHYSIRAFISGKVMTSLQFVAFLILFSGYPLPSLFYWMFGVLGSASLFELLWRD